MNTYYFDYEPGDRVKNPKAPEWGIGQVQSIIKNKVTVNFEMSGHAQLEYQTDKMIKASLLQMLKQHLDEVKRSKFVKIERNYSREKWSKDRLKKRRAA